MEDLKTEIDCPNCRSKIPIRFRDVQPGATTSCPSCGLTVEFTGDSLREVQEQLDRLAKSLNLTLKL